MAKKVCYSKRDVKEIKAMIGLNLAAARRNAGMTQTDVMKALWNVTNSRNRISEIETGKKDLTLIDLLLFHELYGQSLDYICGLSVESEIDMMAGTVNHMVTQSHAMIEMFTGELASAMVTHLKSICKNDHEALLDKAKTMADVVRSEQRLNKASPAIIRAASDLLNIIIDIEGKQARQLNAVDTQMMQIKDRVDKQDRHRLKRDIGKDYQYSLPLLRPDQFSENIDDAVVVGGSNG